MLTLLPLLPVAIGALTALPAGANDSNSLPFVLPERPRFEIPESKPFVIPEPKPFIIPESKPTVPQETKPPEVAKEKPRAVRKRKSRHNSEADQSGNSDAAQPGAEAANTAAATSTSASASTSASKSTSTSASASASASASIFPSTTPVPDADSSAAPPSDAPTSDNTSSAAPPATGTGKRFILQGKTEVVDFKLDEFEGYKQGLAALDKRNYEGAVTLFKAAAAKLDNGYEKYRAQCNFFEAKALMMTGKVDQAISLLKSAIALFAEHDPHNPYKLAAEKQVGDLLSGRARMGTPMLQGRANTLRARTTIDENITLYSRVAADDSDPHLLQVEKEGVPHTIHDCFAEMTCLETAELGSNVYSAIGRWQPLLVKGEPAAIEFGAKPPVINVKVNGQLKEVSVDLPMVNGLRRILLATDGERVCAMDVDNNDTWLLLMDTYQDGSVGRFRWALLRHQKQKSATWGVSRNQLKIQNSTGETWGTRSTGMRGQGAYVNPYSRNNKRNRY